MANQNVNSSEEQSREIMEQNRESDWKGRGFLKELFLGTLHADWIDPWPESELSDEFKAFVVKLERFMIEKVDADKIEETGEYGEDVIDGFRKLGALGMKIPKEYGGLGFSNVEYCKALEMVGRYDGNSVALLSAHQSIGVPNPLKLFGTKEQKEKYLPRCTQEITSFALTEPDVGSDPARLGTTCEKDENGDWIINGEKLWITNSVIGTMMVVMARDPKTNKISAFIVEREWEGVDVYYRCRFMGLKALQNGMIRFTNLKVPKENLLGGEGKGLKLAFITLNVGRLSIPAACVGSSKMLLEECRRWSTERVQWGQPIGKHQAISIMLADMAANTYGQECLAYLAAELSQREGYDIRLEAAAAKEWTTTRNWDIIDNAMQIKGGRGYETGPSLAGRGERPVPIERAMRDSRINRIFEGSSEVMHLFMARELVDTHLKVAGAMFDRKASIMDKLKAIPNIIAFYAVWYPGLWLKSLFTPSYEKYGKLASHMRFAHRTSARLARNVFHGMAIYQLGLERKQGFMFRSVDIAMELFVMVSMIVRTRRLLEQRAPEAKAAVEMTDLFARNTKRYVEANFKAMWSNDDDAKSAIAAHILEERHLWLEPAPAPEASASAEETAAAK